MEEGIGSAIREFEDGLFLATVLGSDESSFAVKRGACAILTGSFGMTDANDVGGSSEAKSIFAFSDDRSDSSSEVSFSPALGTSTFMSVGSIRISWLGVTEVVAT